MKWILKGLQLLLELILFFPLLMVIYVYLLPDTNMMAWYGILAISGLFGLILRGLLHIRQRWILIPVGLILIYAAMSVTIAPAIAFEYSAQWIAAWVITAVLCFLIYFRATLLAVRQWAEVCPLTYYWTSMALYFIGTFFYQHMEQLRPYFSWVLILGLFSLGLTLLRTNDFLLQEASLHRHVPRSLIKTNRWMILSLYVVIVLVSVFRQIHEFLAQMLRMIWNMLFPDSEAEPPPPMEEVEMPPHNIFDDLPPGEPHWIWRVLEIAAIIFVSLAALAGLIWLLMNALPVIKRIVKQVIEKLLSFMRKTDEEGVATGYIDEATTLTSWKDLKKALQNTLAAWRSRKPREPDWHSLQTNQARVRYLYRQLLSRSIANGFQHDPARTSEETLRSIIQWHQHQTESRTKREKRRDPIHDQMHEELTQWIELYHQARYHEQEPEDEPVQRWKSRIQP